LPEDFFHNRGNVDSLALNSERNNSFFLQEVQVFYVKQVTPANLWRSLPQQFEKLVIGLTGVSGISSCDLPQT